MLKSLHEPGFFSAVFSIVHKRSKDEIRSRLTAKDILRILLNLNLNTFRINFAYFDFKTAIRFPIFVNSRVRLASLKGSVKISGRIKPGMILLGKGYVGHFDKRSTHTVWDVSGNVLFKGTALFKNGSKIIVGRDASLELGNNLRFSSNSVLICYKRIVIGDSCRVSWDVQVMDTDFHKIRSLAGEELNPPREIVIGDHVWIGTKVSLMKGARIYADCVVASNSVVTKEISGMNQIIGGIPAKVIKSGITWD